MEQSKIKTELLNKLKILDEKYPHNNIYSLDKWDEKGFPKKIRFELDYNLDIDIEEESKLFDSIDYTIKTKFGFRLDLEENMIFYNSDLRSFCGYIDNTEYLQITVFTNKNGISPVGSDMIHLQNLINDSQSITIIEE